MSCDDRRMLELGLVDYALAFINLLLLVVGTLPGKERVKTSSLLTGILGVRETCSMVRNGLIFNQNS